MLCSEPFGIRQKKMELPSSFLVLGWILIMLAMVEYAYSSCQQLDSIISDVVSQATSQDPRMRASLLRLHFHDCMVHGCDASLLLDGDDSEKFAFPNANSLRGFEVIDQIKSAVVAQCGNTVSCADILALAARESVKLAGGPTWDVNLGRKDSKAAYKVLVEASLPSARESLDAIVTKYAAVGLGDIRDVVALSGAHTFGKSRCLSFINRLYNFNGSQKPDPSMNSTYVAILQRQCPQGGDLSAVVDLDFQTKDTFDNAYYTNLEVGYGLLGSDQELYTDSPSLSMRRWSLSSQAEATRLVKLYAASQSDFFKDFADSMEKMSSIAPPSDSEGEIRLNCRAVNLGSAPAAAPSSGD